MWTEGAKYSDKSFSSRDKKSRKERLVEEAVAQEQSAKVQREPSSDPVRKSRRLAKKSVLDNEIDEDYDTSSIGTPAWFNQAGCKWKRLLKKARLV